MKPLNKHELLAYLRPRPRDFHKGNAGHVLIVGGDEGYAGAVHLAAKAALRVGAGLASVVMRTPTLYVPEVMYHAEQTLPVLLTRATVVVIGPGLGVSDWSQRLLDIVFASDKPLLVDADGLNLLAKHPSKRMNWVLTPHPGEAARLLKTTASVIQADREYAAQTLQETFGGVIVLKGSGTLIASADEMTICEAGNPGMATGGMGDVLSGVIAGLIAQQLPLSIAAQVGVLVHAMAGDRAAANGERGMIASDLMDHLRELVNPSNRDPAVKK